MWTYEQSTGHLTRDGKLRGVGYSGHPPHVNDPHAENVKMVGPICRGDYDINAPISHPHLGPVSLALTPHATNNMHGRGSFFVHGDLIGHEGEQLASDGCVIMLRLIRQAMWDEGDHLLRVI